MLRNHAADSHVLKLAMFSRPDPSFVHDKTHPPRQAHRPLADGRVVVTDGALEQAWHKAGASAADWLSQGLVTQASARWSEPEHPPWLLEVPDVGPACEVLLADQLFHDLSEHEREGLLAWIRSSQDPETGAWSSVDGRPDLSLTVMGWWACVQGGDDPHSERLVRANRVVHALGGAQRAHFGVRLWLALGGLIPWSWLPAVPTELWLLPPSAPLSPARMSPWARGMLTPYLLLARAPARLQLADASALLLPRGDGSPVAPRLTRPGLAGDLLQAFDRTVKLTRKLPRGPLLHAAVDRAQRWIDDNQQPHGGWFSLRPTLLSLLAWRVMGVPSDDPRLRRGLDRLRATRGLVQGSDGRPHLAQGLLGPPTGTIARLLRGQPDDPRFAWLIRQEITEGGPWQLRAEAPPGGWPMVVDARSHLDLEATCRVIDALDALAPSSPHRGPAWAAMRRATDVLLAMQDADGGFSRFERGESAPPMRRLPWHDADLLAFGHAGDESHVRLSALALARLAQTGFRLDDDRVRRGIQWLRSHCRGRLSDFRLDTLVALSRCTGRSCPPGDELRRAVDSHLRSRQAEDGSFGAPVDTARALSGLLELEPPCVQARRAARSLVTAVLDDRDLGMATGEGIGLSPRCHDPSAGAREARLALGQFLASGGHISEAAS